MKFFNKLILDSQKLIATFILMLIFSGMCWSQVSSKFGFSQSAGTYTPITGATVLSSAINQDLATYNVTGLSFPFNGSTISQVVVSTDGYIALGVATFANSTQPISSNNSASGIIAALAMNIVSSNVSGAASTLSWVNNGTETVFQWQDFARLNQAASERFSFQIRINNTTGVIKLVYGSFTVNMTTNYTPQAGLRGATNSDYNARRLTTAVPDSNPSWDDTAPATSNAHNLRFTTLSIAAIPDDGRTFIYTPPPINDDCSGAINLTPNPGYFTDPGLQNMVSSTPNSAGSVCVTNTTNKQDVWFKLTTDNDGILNEHINIAVTPLGTADIAIMLYGGSCGLLFELDCSDDGLEGEVETIYYTEAGFTGDDIETRENEVYYLRIIDFYNESAQFNISALGSTALPVNILSFDAKALNNKTVQLTWNVAAEVDVREYTIERSNDNRNWSAIGSVKASQKSTYGFNDNSPVSGVNYYRLAVKDVNAAVAFSDIRTVNFSGKGNMALYPNPANNTLYVSGTDDKNVVVSIYNEVGQIVNTLSSNGETIRTGGIDVSQLLPGAYSIQVKGESGLTTMRFVKQ